MKLRVTQVRSSNGAIRKQRETLRTLGLGRVGRSTVRSDSEQLRGMLRAVRHLIKVEDFDE